MQLLKKKETCFTVLVRLGLLISRVKLSWLEVLLFQPSEFERHLHFQYFVNLNQEHSKNNVSYQKANCFRLTV